MSNYQLLLPKMGESVAEATIIKWLKNPGDYVEADESILEIATDKVDSEIPSPVAGKLITQLFKVDDVVQVGSPIALIQVEDKAAVSQPQQPATPPITASNSIPQAAPIQQPVTAPVQTQQIPGIDQLQDKAVKPIQAAGYQSNRFYSPLIKSIATQEGITVAVLDTIPGTGAEGRLTKEDLLAYIQSGNSRQFAPVNAGPPAQEPINQEPAQQQAQNMPSQQQAPVGQQPYGVPAQPAYPPQPYMYPPQPYVVYPPIYAPPGYPQQPIFYALPPGYPVYPQLPDQQPVPPVQPAAKTGGNGVSIGADDETVEMDRMRRLIADHMVNSVQMAPHVTSFIEVDVTNLVMWREKAKKQFETKYSEKLTFTPIFIEAVAQTIKALPMINVSVNGTQIIKRKHINIGMATALPTGNLIVPVIKDADQLSLMNLAKAVNDLADRARRNKLQPDEVKEGTFTITNVGSFNNIMGTPIINQPQVAILALGVIKKKPAVVETPKGDIITIRHMMYLSLSYDHRVVDGSLGGMFIKKVADYLEAWDVNKEA